jgi:hypothetical protein
MYGLLVHLHSTPDVIFTVFSTPPPFTFFVDDKSFIVLLLTFVFLLFGAVVFAIDPPKLVADYHKSNRDGSNQS